MTKFQELDPVTKFMFSPYMLLHYQAKAVTVNCRNMYVCYQFLYTMHMKSDLYACVMLALINTPLTQLLHCMVILRDCRRDHIGMYCSWKYWQGTYFIFQLVSCNLWCFFHICTWFPVDVLLHFINSTFSVAYMCRWCTTSDK